jgi:hypothetical protein
MSVRSVAIIGAGPYGLAAAAYLQRAGVPIQVFGEPFEFWRGQMPKGMILRSSRRASHIADPDRRLTIDHYEASEGRELTRPNVTLAEFLDYGDWYRRNAVPDVDRRKVVRLARRDGGFEVTLDDGEKLAAERAVVAAGLSPFGHRPEPFASLPDEFVSHSSDHADLGVFSGRRVLVVGGGQSALESAALLAEAGAEPEVVLRGPQINWLGWGEGSGRSSLYQRSRPPTDVGGVTTGWTAALPDLYRRLPARIKPELSYRCIRPAGAGWLRRRLARIPIATGARAVAAEPFNGEVRVELEDGSETAADHVLLGTGYKVDVARYPFLDSEIARSLDLEDGYPRLGPGLESSLHGLYFLGAPAALTFGPVMRFVVGTWYAAPALTQRVLGRRQPPLRFAF